MEPVLLPEHSEEISLDGVIPERYMPVLQKAATLLRWMTVAINGNTIICHTPYNERSAGEIVTITADRKKATLHSRPANEYYHDAAMVRNNAILFRKALAQVIEEEEKADRNLHPMHREKYGALLISKSYVVTPLLVYANTLVFIAMVLAGISPLHPTAKSLFLWGGNLAPAVVTGQWWRLITYMFLHGGALHLIMNTFALLYIGMFLEPLMGRIRFTGAYLLTGICAGLLSIAVHTNSVGVGASGAIFGMYGVFLSMLTTSHIQKTLRKTMMRSILFFVVYNLLAGLQGNTDNAAHIGGLLSGIAIGYAYYPDIARKSSHKNQLLLTGILALATVVLVVASVYLVGKTIGI
ncbi:hypothetical protein GCM10023093_02700 [Nemorincola caseinilytica]|uniref:Peptidase S54 rhomboid domain-containing protein n=1 Tax=Nemorincola caseinilytica TaxID=2054315 RepID=A0ABP8N6V5_9BACT